MHLVYLISFLRMTFLFGKATIREATTLEECLGKYMAWSGQKVNRDKSLVHFSKNFRGQAMVYLRPTVFEEASN